MNDWGAFWEAIPKGAQDSLKGATLIGIWTAIQKLWGLRNQTRKVESEIQAQASVTDLAQMQAVVDGLRADYNRIREEQKELRQEFREQAAQYAKLEHKYEDALKEIDRLSKELSKHATATPDLPIPAWFKDSRLIMRSLNQAYVDAFLIPKNKTAKDYIGKTDFDVWGEAVAEGFRNFDSKAVSLKMAGFVPEDELPDPLLHNYYIFKWPVFIDGAFVGVSGIAIPKNLLDMDARRIFEDNIKTL